ncbi:tetratricopeptide repeat protein [Flavobacterium sp. F-328]|uniref:histidine kinase n=1 Tax=Flavobacterium erciyesense TaxID=2825842 RepID=A0ABS5D195_9FLAO|nr:ATP-binding protein [Flavobacterium erciyesense]MBQ0907782.1 tetratricopeptide repeat protein [Flavobacterium erciyesense]
MILQKVRFPFFIFLLFIGDFFCSCSKTTPNQTAVKSVTVYEKYITTAEDFYAEGVYDSAYYYYNQIRTQSSAKEDAEKIVYALLKMAAIQQTQGDYVGSEVTATEAISYFKNKIETQYKVAIYNSLGINYKNLYDYPNAITYYKKASELADTPLQKEIMQNNIAVVNMEQQNYKQAIQSLESLSKSPIAQANLEHLARVLGNLGYCYYKIGDNRSGMVLKRALKIRQQLQFDYGLVTSFNNLAQYYQRRQPQLAIKYAQESYAKATVLKSIDDRLSALALLMEISTPLQVRNYTKKYLQLNDSITKVRQIAKNQFAKIKYDATQAQNENLQLKTDNAEKALALEQEKLQNYMLFFIMLLGVILALILYFYLQDKNKKEKQAAIYESEIRISKKLHDELANDVYQTIAFAETQDLQNVSQKETLLDNLDKIYRRTRNISRENSPIPTGETYESELKEMLSSFNAAQVQVILKDSNSIPWNKITEEKKIALYRVLQELMINMKKHSQGTFVVLRFETDNKQCYVHYSDNGIGIKNPLQSKNGLLNVENRIDAIGGSIIFDSKSSKGLKIRLTFPK